MEYPVPKGPREATFLPGLPSLCPTEPQVLSSFSSSPLSLALLPYPRASSAFTHSATHLFSVLPAWKQALRPCETGMNPLWSGDSGASRSGWPLSHCSSYPPSSTLAGHPDATHSTVSRVLHAKGTLGQPHGNPSSRSYGSICCLLQEKRTENPSPDVA